MSAEQPAAIRVASAEWVAGDAALSELYTLTLRMEPNRGDWFDVILPALDYELAGGTWDQPKWAWQEHPWFAALGLTVEECEEALSNG